MMWTNLYKNAGDFVLYISLHCTFTRSRYAYCNNFGNGCTIAAREKWDACCLM